jgi:hypothetical protein
MSILTVVEYRDDAHPTRPAHWVLLSEAGVPVTAWGSLDAAAHSAAVFAHPYRSR